MFKEILSKITNPSGSITGMLLVVAGFMETVLGCKAGGANPLEATCSASWLESVLPAQYLVYAAMVFGVITMIGKLGRPGTIGKSLFGSTAVVVPAGQDGPGTVTSIQVDSH